jgi:capsid protein
MGLLSFFRRKPAGREVVTVNRPVRAGYDAARTSDEFKNYWANADKYDADSAHSKTVRHTLISRSRYELNSNGYSDGIAQTYATDLIGNGPALRMQTNSTGFNQMVENTWYLWCKAIHFRRKLWCLAHAKHSDGEAFAVLRRNPRVMHPIALDVVLYEAEQVQTPYLPFDKPGYIDGIKFDEFGNPEWYDLLKYHPGAMNGVTIGLDDVERIPANRMLHWFRMRRPGQHRGVPEMASTLNTGAAARRWREATLGAAETAADFSVFLKTEFQPSEIDALSPMSTLDIEKRMMTALPQGWDAHQMKAEHPNANYEAFHKTLINEQARPKSMPYNKAACDSSSYNYASGRLDHQTYYAALDVEREDCNDLVLDPLFNVWLDLAIARFGWLGGDPAVVSAAARSHLWDWPKHRVADVKQEADANATKLTSGQIGLHRLYTDAGLDMADEVAAMAQAFGVDEAEIKKRLLEITMPMPKQPQAAEKPQEPDDDMAAVLRKRFALNGNGVH